MISKLLTKKVMNSKMGEYWTSKRKRYFRNYWGYIPN